MTTPFLLTYAAALIDALIEGGLAEIAADDVPEVVGYVALELERNAQSGSLISCTSRALLACPKVVELYADDDEIKEIVQELGSSDRRAMLRR